MFNQSARVGVVNERLRAHVDHVVHDVETRRDVDEFDVRLCTNGGLRQTTRLKSTRR